MHQNDIICHASNVIIDVDALLWINRVYITVINYRSWILPFITAAVNIFDNISGWYLLNIVTKLAGYKNCSVRFIREFSGGKFHRLYYAILHDIYKTNFTRRLGPIAFSNCMNK